LEVLIKIKAVVAVNSMKVNRRSRDMAALILEAGIRRKGVVNFRLQPFTAGQGFGVICKDEITHMAT
jgi:hypothetical protein